jgi:hypothetical protein
VGLAGAPRRPLHRARSHLQRTDAASLTGAWRRARGLGLRGTGGAPGPGVRAADTPHTERNARSRLRLAGRYDRGRIPLVVHAHHPGLDSRCLPAPILPSAHVHPAPAGVLLREARALTLRWREPVRAAPSGPVIGSVSTRIRLRVVPESRLARELSPRPCGPRLEVSRSHGRESPGRRAGPRAPPCGASRAS